MKKQPVTEDNSLPPPFLLNNKEKTISRIGQHKSPKMKVIITTVPKYCALFNLISLIKL